MAYEQKDNTGTMFKNDRKVPGGPQPDRKGECLIGGKAYWVAGWLKESKSGQQYLSLAFTEKDTPVEKHAKAHATPQRPGSAHDIENDVPW